MCDMYILAISPGRDSADGPKWEAVARSGIDALMIREKHLDARSLLDLGKRVRDIAPGITLWINGRLDIALALGAGFHGGYGYPKVPPAICPVSRPLHSLAQVKGRHATDQLLISPVFDVPGKGQPIGVHGLHDILGGMPPWKGKLLALGGINAENAASLQHDRLDGVALIRGLWGSGCPRETVDRLRCVWKRKTC